MNMINKIRNVDDSGSSTHDSFWPKVTSKITQLWAKRKAVKSSPNGKKLTQSGHTDALSSTRPTGVKDGAH